MVLILFASRCGISLKIGVKVQATLGFRRNLPPSYGHSVFLKDSVSKGHMAIDFGLPGTSIFLSYSLFGHSEQAVEYSCVYLFVRLIWVLI